MIGADIIERAGHILHDEGTVRWKPAELLLYIADAENQIIEVKPTANSVTDNIAIAPNNPLQAIPSDAVKLLRLVRNMGTDGETPGRAIILTSRATLDSLDVEWPRRTGSAIEHWIYDPEGDRDVFWVTPFTTQEVFVEAVYAKRPAALADDQQELTLGDQYINQVLDWVLYRAFSKDAEYGSVPQRAMQHYQAFSTALGVKMQTMQRTNPNITRRGGETMGKV